MSSAAAAAGYGQSFSLTLVTADVDLARAADVAGVAHIGVDLERLGKAERQPGGDNRVSNHDWNDLRRIVEAVSRDKVFVRLNALHDASGAEVDTAVELGAAVVMLPYVRTAEAVERFAALVAGRARVAVMIETAAALVCLPQILAAPGVEAVTVGLNDLRHDLELASHFDVLASPLLETVADETRRRGVRLSIGGVGRADDTGLPIPPELVYAQLPRLGAQGAWLARSFLRGGPDRAGALAGDIARLRRRLDYWGAATAGEIEAARQDLEQRAKAVFGEG